MLPYGYPLDPEKDGITVAPFTQDVIQRNDDAIRINVRVGPNEDFKNYGDFKFFPYRGILASVYSGTTANETSQAFFNRTLSYYTTANRWNTVITNYKNAIGGL